MEGKLEQENELGQCECSSANICYTLTVSSCKAGHMSQQQKIIVTGWLKKSWDGTWLSNGTLCLNSFITGLAIITTHTHWKNTLKIIM